MTDSRAVTTSTWRHRPVVAALAVTFLAVVVPATPARASTPSRVKRPAVPAWPTDTVPGSLLVTTTDGHTTDVHVEPGTESRAAATIQSRSDVLSVEPD